MSHSRDDLVPLFGLLQINLFAHTGDDRVSYLTAGLAEMTRLESDLGLDEWDHTTITVDGLGREALLHRSGNVSAAVVDIDELVALGISGRGGEPGDYDLVATEGLSSYPSRY